MKILFFLDSFPAYSETFIYNQIIFLLENNFDVRIFSIKKGDSFLHEKVLRNGLDKRVSFLRHGFGFYLIKNLFLNFDFSFSILKNTNFKKSLFYINNLDLFLAIDQFKITHTHFGHIGELVCFLKKIRLLKKTEIVHSFHGFDLLPDQEDYYQLKYENLFKFCNIYTVNSQYTLKILQKFSNVESNKIRLLPVSLDTSYFSKVDFESVKDFRIIFVGRLIDWKSPVNALKILRILRQRDFPVFLDIIGEGREKKTCEDFINEYSLHDSVSLLGALNQKDLKVRLSQAGVFIAPGITDTLTSRAENQGLVLQEAQSMELPVIVSNAGGMKFGLIDGVTGYVIDEDDIDGFVEKIIYLYNFPEIRINMGKRGRKYVEENFDYKVLGNKLLEIYYS